MPERGNAKKSKKAKPSSTRVTPPAGTSLATGCKDWGWWQAGPGGRKKPYEDYTDPKKVPVAVRAEFDKMRKRYQTGGLRNGANIKNLGNGIYELRYSHTGNTPFRLLFMRWGEYAIVLDVFKKTTNETPTDRAAQRRAAWLSTFGDAPDQ